MNPTIEKESNTSTTVTGAEMMTEITLLAKAGHCQAEPGDDDESRRFAAEAVRLNPGWSPGAIPRVPTGYHSGERLRRPTKPQRHARPTPSLHVPSSRGPSREKRGTRRRAAARTPSSQDGSEPPRRGAGGRPPAARQAGSGDWRQLTDLDVVERAEAAWRIISANPKLYDARERLGIFMAAVWPLEHNVKGA